MNNYDAVLAMPDRTIFQFENGAPWMRTKDGVLDLCLYSLPRSMYEIPEVWKTFDHKITILHDPAQER